MMVFSIDAVNGCWKWGLLCPSATAGSLSETENGVVVRILSHNPIIYDFLFQTHLKLLLNQVKQSIELTLPLLTT